MATDAQEVVSLIKQQIQTYLEGENWKGGDVTIDINGILPEDVSAGGYVNVCDGDPGEPDEVLGGFTPCYYQHNVEVDIIVCSANSETRERKYARLKAAVGAALAADETLGGKVIAMDYSEPSPNNERIMGAEDMKAATLNIVVDYVTNGKIPAFQEETEE